MLTLVAAQVCFFVALVRASKFPLLPRSGTCTSSGPGYSERSCGDICLPVGQFCCGQVPSSSLLYACPIGTVCNDYFISNSDYLARCCEGWVRTPGTYASCQVVSPFPSTSYIQVTATAPSPVPSPTACGAQVNAEGYSYRACGDVCLDVEHLCCGFIPGTNQAWSCAVGQSCVYTSYSNIPWGSCVDASGYIMPGTIFIARNSTTASSPPSSSTNASTISSSTTSPASTISSSSTTTTTTSTISSSTTTISSTISSSTPTITSGNSSSTSSTGASTTSNESGSTAFQNSSSSTTSQLPISTTNTVAASSSPPGAVISSVSTPAFTGAATRHGPIENSHIYALGGLIVGAAARNLGLF